MATDYARLAAENLLKKDKKKKEEDLSQYDDLGGFNIDTEKKRK